MTVPQRAVLKSEAMGTLRAAMQGAMQGAWRENFMHHVKTNNRHQFRKALDRIRVASLSPLADCAWGVGPGSVREPSPVP